jgi:hypothetical protein
MKLKTIIVGVVACLSLAVAAQAATTTNILDWTFSTSANPSAPDAATSINPDGGNPEATFTGNNNTYYFGAGPQGVTGSPTGLWDMENGQLQLSLDLAAVGTVAYTLQIWQFADAGRSIYPGAVSFSPSGGQFVSETVYVPQSGNMIGSWYEDTYSWSGVALDPSVSLDITASPVTGAVLFDQVQLTVVGDLVPVPEPSCGLMTLAGLLAFGMISWCRRKV